MKKIVVGLCFFTVTAYAQFTHYHTYLLEHSGLSKRNQTVLNNLLNTIDAATMYQQIQAASQAANRLQSIIDAKTEVYNAAYNEDKGPLGCAIEIVSLQQSHFKDFARIEWHHLSYKNRIVGWLYAVIETIKKQLRMQKNSTIDDLAKALCTYTKLEQTECLQTYDKAQHYFVFQQDIKLPEAVNFWAYQPIRFSLTQHIKKWTSIPKIQASLAVAVVKEATEGATNAIGETAIINAVGQTISMKLTDGTVVSLAPLADGTAVPFSVDLVAALQAIAKEVADGITQMAAVAEKEAAAFDAAGYTLPSSLEKQTAIIAQAKAAGGIGGMLGEDVGTVAAAAVAEKVVTPGVEVVSQAESEVASQIASMSNQDFRTLIATKLATTGDARFTEVAKLLGTRQAVAQASKASETVIEKMFDSIWISQKNVEYTLKNQIKALNTIKSASGAGTQAVADRVATLQGVLKSLKNNLALTASKSSAAKYQGWVIMGFDVALQMGVMMSAPVGIQWVDASDALLFAQLKLKQTQLQNQFLVTINNIQALSQDQIQLSEQAASWGLGILKAQQDQLTTLFSSQQTYLLQSLVTANMANNYVSNPMIWDQYFFNGPMYTPLVNGAAIQAKNNAGNGVSAIPYPIQKPVFYTGPWSVSPMLKTNNLADTYLWKVINGTLTVQDLSPQPVITAPATALPTMTQAFPTQSLPHTWYNIGRRGNWGYSPTDDSFYQYQAVSNIVSASSQVADPVEAGFNSIFTEYVPPTILDSTGVPTYQIQAEIQITTAKTPWIAGIMFNGGRWISGVTDQSNQYRFCGLYGSGQGTAPITFCAAESFYVTSTVTGVSNLSPITPLAQLLNPASVPTVSNNVGNIIQNPLYPTGGSTNQALLALGQTYVITIYTQPTQFFVSLDMKNADGSLKNIFGPVALANRNPILFNFHTIGFISSGCSARFSLKKPQQLVFNSSDITTFTQSMLSGAKS